MSNPSPNNKALRGKVDDGLPDGGNFPPGSKDRIYQIVSLPTDYTGFHFEYDEVQHELGSFIATIYGRVVDGEWVVLWQSGLEASFAVDPYDWQHFTHDFLAPGYDEAMLEFWLMPDAVRSGVKLTNLDLRVVY